MKIISIGTDKTIIDENFESHKRQLAYYNIFDLAEIVVLNSGTPKTLYKGNINFYFPGGNKLTSLVRSFFLLINLARLNKYDVVYTQDVLYSGVLGYVFSLTTGAKLITQLHGDYLDNPLWINQRKENIFLNVIGKYIVKKSYKVRCVSNRIVKYVLENLKNDPHKVKSLPIGIDGKNFNNHGILPTRKKQVIFLGRLIDEKEPLLFTEIVISIMQKYPDFTAVIIGAGELKWKMEATFKENNLQDRVTFTGFIGFPEIAKYFKESYVLIKTAFWEGWGMQMVEASACGMPVISTDTGCAGEVIINGYNGILIDTKDRNKAKQDFVNALEEIIQDQVLYKQLCDNAMNGSDKWTFETIKGQIQEFVKN